MILKYTQAELKTLGNRGINRLVAKHLFNDCRTRHVRDGGDSISVDEQSGKIYDFVNCPNDIIPLQIEHKISIGWVYASNNDIEWSASGRFNDQEDMIFSRNKNLLRAICECLILMKQEKIYEI